MFFTYVTRFLSSWYLSAAFQSNIDCFSVQVPVLCLTCTDLLVFIGFFAYLTAIIAALAAILFLWQPSVSMSYFSIV